MKKSEYFVKVTTERPFFRYIPCYLWGEGVDYDSDGDCRFPEDRNWTELTVINRANKNERIDIDPVQKDPLILKVVSENDALAKKTAQYLAQQTMGTFAIKISNL